MKNSYLKSYNMNFINQVDSNTWSFDDTYSEYVIKLENGLYIVYDIDMQRIDNMSFDSIESLDTYYENLTAEQYDENN